MTDELADLIDEVVEAGEADKEAKDIQAILANQDSEEIALLLESLPLDQRLTSGR